jgi:hypothetical protein
MAEEGEATPLLRSLARSSGRLSVSPGGRGAREVGEDGEAVEQEQDGSWYEGPLFVAGVKLALLFMLFMAVVVGTFWFGMPPVDPYVLSTSLLAQFLSMALQRHSISLMNMSP